MVSPVTIYYLIWIALYLVYIGSIYIDYNSMMEYTDYFIWGAIWLLTLGLLIVGILSLMYIRGYPFERFGSRGLIFSAIILVGLLIGLFYLQRWQTQYTYNSVRDKARRRNYRPLDYEYGRDSQDLAQRFRIVQSNVLNRLEPQSMQELWEYLMVKHPNQVTSLLNEILGTYPSDSPDVHYNLLWYLCIANEPLRSNLSPGEIRYVCNLDTTTLQRLVRDGIRPVPTVESTYTGLTDRASLIFTLLSGYFVPAPENLSRYPDIKKYSPHIVYNLAFTQHHMIDHNNGTYQVYPPHIYLAQQPESPIEKIITQVTASNCDQIIEAYQLVPYNQIKTRTFDQKMRMIQEDLSLYHHVFTRPKDMMLPPSLHQMTALEIQTVLSYYTNMELVNYYEPRHPYSNRNELFRVIQNDILGAPTWSILSRGYCTNDATMNIITGELHGETNKDDPSDPTLSFGQQRNYRCYQASELEGSFREYNGIFQFRIPDYLPENPGPSDFPLDSMKQLQRLLEQNPTVADSLLHQIQNGLAAMKSARVQTHIFKRDYRNFSQDHQLLIRKYLAWMFVYSMWMRFWKGPGHPWPLKKVMVEFALTRSLGKRASPEDRDEHVFIQEGLRTRLIEMAESNPDVLAWINTLPAVHYDFDNGDSHVASYTIKEKMDQLALGNECMGFGSDIILKTAYYYILFILEVEEGPSFDSFIYNQLPALLGLEQQVITTQLQALVASDNPARARVLNHRLETLSQPLPIQPSFNPKLYETNVHVN